MNKETSKLLNLYKDKQPQKKDDLSVDRYSHTEITLKSIGETKELIAKGEALCELKTSKNGGKQLTVYKTLTREKIFYTESPWQIGQILENVAIFDK